MSDIQQTNVPFIGREQFVAAVGREPEQDDLERCNCPNGGEIGHFFCGWNQEKNLPVFMVGREVKHGG